MLQKNYIFCLKKLITIIIFALSTVHKMINDSLQVDDPSNFGVPISSTNKK